MNLSMGEIGSTPPASTNDPNAVGAIGLPIWLWIANRAENTVGPIVRSASDGGLTVSATGTLNRVEWTLTDANGATVGAITCDGANAPGTPYDGRNSAEPSPTCGFGADLNSSPGTLTLTGTAYWVVEWQGGGQTGQIDVPAQSNSTQVRIGELQALVRD
ncbi:ATP/GTP-binding protein [Promicromonospora soli]|nr:ATP/GTP-binding protein [Promicromonospora soli]